MPARRIAVTGSAEYQALGAGGTLAVDHWEALTAQIAAELGPAHAALFAEPQRNPARGEIDWYAEGAGAAVRADTLPEAEKDALLARWHAMREEIRRLAARIGARPDASSRFMGVLIDAALSLPSPEARNVWRVDDRPVLVAWGHERAGAAVMAETLTGRMAAADAPMRILPPPPRPMPPGPRFWPPVAALAGALTLLALALLVAWHDPLGLLRTPDVACVADPDNLAALAGLREASDHESALRRELARLVADAGERRTACAPVAPPPPERRAETLPPPPPQRPRPEQPPPSPDAERAARAGGRTGRLQIILAWEDVNDLDLYVVCPSGEQLGPDTLHACGGRIDVDANRGGANPAPNLTRAPVENAVWAQPPPGRYRVHVNACCGSVRQPPGSNFRITIRQAGKPDRVIPGYARAGGGPGGPGAMVTTVDVPPP